MHRALTTLAGFYVWMMVSGPAQAGPPEAPAEEDVQYGRLPPLNPETNAQRSDWLLNHAKWLDELKKELDEWGTMAFAPFLFAPAEEESNQPFKLREGEVLTLNGLYKDYNESQGSSRFFQQTRTQNYVAYGEGFNPMAQKVIQAQADLYETNTQRSLADEAESFQRTEQAHLDAQTALAAAKEEDAKAKAEVETLTARVATANEQAKLAQENLQTAQTAKAPTSEILAAQNKLTLAKKEQLLATNAQARATERKTAAGKTLATAEETAITAKSKFDQSRTTAATSAAKPSTPAPANSETATTVPPVDAAAAGTTGRPSLKTLSGYATENLGTLGNVTPQAGGSMPDTMIPASAPAADKAGIFPPLNRVNSAASALTVKNILTFLGNPQAAALFQDRRVLFGVTSLSVNPGWRTKQDFKGVIDAQVVVNRAPASTETLREILRNPRYPVGFRARLAHDHPAVLTAEQRAFFKPRLDAGDYDSDAKCAPYLNEPVPPSSSLLVHAVTPMVDSQNLDLASSIARQDEVAMFLAASLSQAGHRRQGQAFSSWARLRRKDVATRTTVATANSFSTGDHFGFEIGTRLRGLDDDNAKGDKAAQTLDRQTFPVLLLLGTSQQDTLPHFSRLDDGRIGVTEPRFDLAYSTRWSRTHRNVLTWWYKAQRRPSEAYQEMMRTGGIRDVIETKWAKEKQLYDPKSQYQEGYFKTLKNMERECDSIVQALHGADCSLAVPSRWLMQNNDGITDKDLFDAEALVSDKDLKFDPAPLRFPAAGRVATVLLKGKNLHNLDPSRIRLVSSSNDVTLDTLPMAAGQTTPALPTARLIDRETIAIDLKLAAESTKPGSVQFQIPYRGSKAAKENENARADPRFPAAMVQTSPLPYAIGSVAGPSVAAWQMTELVMPGSMERVPPPTVDLIVRILTAAFARPAFEPWPKSEVEHLYRDKLFTADLSLQIKGQRLDTFHPWVWLTAPGLDVKLPLQAGGSQVALMETSSVTRFQTTASQGLIKLRFAVPKNPCQAVVPGAISPDPMSLLPDGFRWLDSAPLAYRIDLPSYPSIEKWAPGQETVMAFDTDAANDKWKATFQLVLQGTELQQLATQGTLQGDLTGTATIAVNGDHTATVSLTDVRSATSTGTARIAFPLKTTPLTGAATTNLHTTYFTYRIVAK